MRRASARKTILRAAAVCLRQRASAAAWALQRGSTRCCTAAARPIAGSTLVATTRPYIGWRGNWKQGRSCVLATSWAWRCAWLLVAAAAGGAALQLRLSAAAMERGSCAGAGSGSTARQSITSHMESELKTSLHQRSTAAAQPDRPRRRWKPRCWSRCRHRHSSSWKEVSACSECDSDARIELAVCDLPPSGEEVYESTSQLLWITRSSRSRPSLHHSACKQQQRSRRARDRHGRDADDMRAPGAWGCGDCGATAGTARGHRSQARGGGQQGVAPMVAGTQWAHATARGMPRGAALQVPDGRVGV